MKRDIEELYNQFLEDFKLSRRVGTIESYRGHSKEFITRFKAKKGRKLNDINQSFINNYIRDLMVRGLGASAINKKIYSIVLFYRWLLSNKYVKSINFTYKKLEEFEKPIECLTIEELKIFLDYISKCQLKQRLIFYLLLTTGIRRNELIHIKKEYIDLSCNRIFLDFTKNHKARYCFINEECKSLIREYVKEDKLNKTKYLFVSSNGIDLIKGTYITQLFYYLKVRTGLKVCPNILRHTYASYLLKNGANIEELRALMGHSDYRITKRYVLMASEELQQANKNYNVIESIRGIN